MSVLTRRQVEVLSLIADGCTEADVALLLGISPNTVKTHMSGIFHRLKVHTQWHAVAVAMRTGELR